MTTKEALLHAVRDNPEEDTPRLLLADYLDGEADPAWVRCPLEYCVNGYWRHSGDPNTRPHRCDRCDGRGEVNHNAEWAELIRVQVERHRRYPSYQVGMTVDGATRVLVNRERELTAALGSRLSAPCPGVDGFACHKGKVYDGPGGGQRAERTCPTCNGAGDLYKSRETHTEGGYKFDQNRPHHFDRGCLYLRVTLGEVCQRAMVEVPDMNAVNTGEPTFTTAPDPRVNPDWRPTPWAAALPPEVVGLWCTDKDPAGFQSDKQGWTWCKIHSVDDHQTDSWVLLGPVFDALSGHYNAEPEQSGQRAVKRYRTPHLARLHLAHALRRFAAGQSG